MWSDKCSIECVIIFAVASSLAAKYSRGQHFSQWPVWVGPHQSPQQSWAVCKTAVCWPRFGRRICHYYCILNSWTAQLAHTNLCFQVSRMIMYLPSTQCMLWIAIQSILWQYVFIESWHYFLVRCSEAPLPSIKFPVRQLGDAEQWGPTLQVLSDAEMEKKMRDQDRNTRCV